MGFGYPLTLLRVWHLGFYVGSIQDQQQGQPVLRFWGFRGGEGGRVHLAGHRLLGFRIWHCGFGCFGSGCGALRCYFIGLHETDVDIGAQDVSVVL